MKRYLYLLAAAALVLLAGCTKKSLPSITLSSDKEQVSVTAYNNSIAFTLKWDQTGGNSPVTQTFVQFCTDKEFVSPYVLRSSGTSFVVTYKDLKKIQDNFGVLDDYELIIRLLVEGEEVPSVYSNKIRVKIDL
ncbi:MAG: SusE domain-containing protein [Bacteroidales bacterium]|nr:SusE domain-containing protein [Bacteroidales bacterium]